MRNSIEKQKKLFIHKGYFLYAFIIIFLFTAQTGKTQTPQKNLEKYWFYRQRLQEHFVYQTNNPMNPGTNQPAEGIYVYRTSEGIKTTADWGDAVWWLGHYIGMLAMEYKLLKNNNQPYETTLLDLKNALITYYRLDENAEPYFGGQSSTNGFYIRDDVPNDSLVRKQLQVDLITSCYTKNIESKEALGNSPSQDQVWSMSVGLALVQKCVDDEKIVKISQDIAYLLVTGMQISKNSKSKSWGIINPVTGLNVAKKRGQNISSLKYAWGAVGTQLSGQDLHCANSQGKIAKIVWNTMQNNLFLEFPSLGINQRVFNWYGILCLSTVMNEWGNESSYNNLYDWLVYQGNRAAGKRPQLRLDELYIHLPAIAEILHGYDGNDLLSPGKYEYYLNSAPADGGHRYHLDGEFYQSEKPWHSQSLFCPTHLYFEGEYNMIDYMLLYNAYFLVYHHNEPINDSITDVYKDTIRVNTFVLQMDTTLTMQGQLDSCLDINPIIRLYPEFNVYFLGDEKNSQVYYHKTNIEPYIIPWGNFKQREAFIDTTTYKSSLGINTVSTIEVYFNPMEKSIRICRASNYQYIVSDKNGKVALKGTIAGEDDTRLDISMLQSGSYFLNIYSNNLLAGTFKINKEEVVE